MSIKLLNIEDQFIVEDHKDNTLILKDLKSKKRLNCVVVGDINKLNPCLNFTLRELCQKYHVSIKYYNNETNISIVVD
jgi:hypothetical protein